MSVLIKGMNMPKDDCKALRQITITNAWVDGEIKMLAHDTVTNEFIGEVVEVPTPHGRLIDADATEEKSGDWFVTELDTVGYSGSLREFLSEQPTVIEAETNHE